MITPVAILAGTLALLWAAARPQRLVLVLVALVPFDGLLIVVPHPSILAGWKEALVLLAVGTAYARRDPERLRTPLPAWTVAFAALLVLGLASAALHPGTRALVGLEGIFFFALVALALRWSPFTARDRDRLVTILMATAAVTAIAGIGQRLVGDEALVRLGYEYNEHIRFAGGQLRSISTFNQPFPFALWVMAVILVAAPVAWRDRGRLRNRLFLLGLPVMALGMLTAVVRSSVLGLAVGAWWLAMQRPRVLVRVLSLAVVVLVLLPGPVRDGLFSPDSLEERGATWTALGEDLVDLPLGQGIGSTGAAAERAGEDVGVGPAAVGDGALQPDNYYVKLWLELGPLGLWLFAAFLVTAVGAGRRTARAAEGADAALARGATASFIAAAAAATVATYWEIFPVDALFWVLLGVLLSIAIDINRPSPSTPSPSALPAVASRPTSGSCSGHSPA